MLLLGLLQSNKKDIHENKHFSAPYVITPVNHMFGWSAQECWEHLLNFFFLQKIKFTSKTKRECKIEGIEHEKAWGIFGNAGI